MIMKDLKDITKNDSPKYIKAQIEKIKLELEELISKNESLTIPKIVNMSQKLDELILKYIKSKHSE